MAETRSELPDMKPKLADRLERQLEQWRRKLVATDRRQRLLYFKHNRTGSLELIHRGSAAIAGLLDQNAVRMFTLVPDAQLPAVPGDQATTLQTCTDSPWVRTRRTSRPGARARVGSRLAGGI